MPVSTLRVVKDEAFKHLRTRLRDSGHREIAAGYNAGAFGSWFITLEGTPRLRVVWDGRDRSLVIQHQTAEETWRDEWVASDSDQTPDAVVRAIAGI